MQFDKTKYAFVWAACLSLMVGCKSDDDAPGRGSESETVYSLLIGSGSYSSIVIDDVTALEEIFKSESSSILCIPSDEAWTDFAIELGYPSIVQLAKHNLKTRILPYNAGPIDKVKRKNTGSFLSYWANLPWGEVSDLIEINDDGTIKHGLFTNEVEVTAVEFASNGVVFHTSEVLIAPSQKERLLRIKGTNLGEAEIWWEFEGMAYLLEQLGVGNNAIDDDEGLEDMLSNQPTTVFYALDAEFRAINWLGEVEDRTGVFEPDLLPVRDESPHLSFAQTRRTVKKLIVEGVFLEDQLLDGLKLSRIDGGSIDVYVNPGTRFGIFGDWNGDYDPDLENTDALDSQIAFHKTTKNGVIYLINEIGKILEMD